MLYKQAHRIGAAYQQLILKSCLVMGKAIEDDGAINKNHLCPLSSRVTFILEKNSLILHTCISKHDNKYRGENGKQESIGLVE